MTDAAREQWQMGAEAEQRHLEALLAAPDLTAKLMQVYDSGEAFPAQPDPDRDLYGGFLSDDDRRRCEGVRRAGPEELASLHPGFDAAKLEELLFRYRARNWPETLSAEERVRWEVFRRERLTDPVAGASIVLGDYRKQLSRLAVDAGLTRDQHAVVDALIDWPAEIGL